jgi:hypothetical protein
MSKREGTPELEDAKRAKTWDPVVTYDDHYFDSYVCAEFDADSDRFVFFDETIIPLDEFQFKLSFAYKRDAATYCITVEQHGGRLINIVTEINNNLDARLTTEFTIPFEHVDRSLFLVVRRPFAAFPVPRDALERKGVAMLTTNSETLALPIFSQKLVNYSEYFEMLLRNTNDEEPTFRLDLSDDGLTMLHRYIDRLDVSVLHALGSIDEMLALLTFLHQCLDETALHYLDFYLLEMMIQNKNDTDKMVVLMRFLANHTWAGSTIGSIVGTFKMHAYDTITRIAFPIDTARKAFTLQVFGF